MTAKELIAELSKLPPDIPVTRNHEDFPRTIRTVEVTKATMEHSGDWREVFVWDGEYFHDEEDGVMYDIAVLGG